MILHLMKCCDCPCPRPDTPQSVWLSSYIAQVLDDIRVTMPESYGFSVDSEILESTVDWLLARQKEEGNFRETDLFPDYTQSPTEFQDIAVTAQVIITLSQFGHITETYTVTALLHKL